MLKVEGLVKRFGGLVAVNDVSFSVPVRSIVGLIGINGAGKTTVMNCISGLYRSDAGSVTVNEADITHRTPHEIAHAGVGRTFQVPRVFRRMTLIDNLLIPRLDSVESDAALTDQAVAMLEQVNLRDLRQNFAEELSGGQQKLLELARVMMFDPDLILLDEPFAGVNPGLCRLIIDQILRLVENGKTFLLVSHDLTSIYRLSHRIIVLNQGRIISEGDAASVRSDPKVIEAYLGG